MRSEILKKIADRVPLETKIKVQLEMGAIDLITKLGYRESKPWDESESDMLAKISEWAKVETDYIMKKVNKNV